VSGSLSVAVVAPEFPPDIGGVETYSHEGFGIVSLEANACGVPVLACRSGGAVEAVEEGVSGLFVERPAPAAIGTAVEQFLTGAVRFAPAACQAFARRFGWGRVVDRVEPFYVR